MEVTLIVLVILLAISGFTNVVLVKRLIKYEDDNQQREDDIQEAIEDLRRRLDVYGRVVREVAGAEVVSNEPFVKRVVKAIGDANQAFIDTVRKLERFDLESTQQDDEEK